MWTTWRPRLARFYYRLAYPRFLDLKDEADGMLAPPVYERIHREILGLPDLDMIEVGGAAGAIGVAAAWAMRESGKTSRLVIVERCEGGSRSVYGGREANLERLEGNLRRLGAADHVVVHPHELTLESGKDVLSLVRTQELSALIHDADGQIDRDFRLFWPTLRTGGLIVIDDFVDQAGFRPVTERYPDGGTKCLLTYKLLTRFIEWGLFEPFVQVRSTVFGRKPQDDFSRFDAKICENIREEIAAEHRAWIATRDAR